MGRVQCRGWHGLPAAVQAVGAALPAPARARTPCATPTAPQQHPATAATRLQQGRAQGAAVVPIGLGGGLHRRLLDLSLLFLLLLPLHLALALLVQPAVRHDGVAGAVAGAAPRDAVQQLRHARRQLAVAAAGHRGAHEVGAGRGRAGCAVHLPQCQHLRLPRLVGRAAPVRKQRALRGAGGAAGARRRSAGGRRGSYRRAAAHPLHPQQRSPTRLAGPLKHAALRGGHRVGHHPLQHVQRGEALRAARRSAGASRVPARLDSRNTNLGSHVGGGHDAQGLPSAQLAQAARRLRHENRGRVRHSEWQGQWQGAGGS